MHRQAHDLRSGGITLGTTRISHVASGKHILAVKGARVMDCRRYAKLMQQSYYPIAIGYADGILRINARISLWYVRRTDVVSAKIGA